MGLVLLIVSPDDGAAVAEAVCPLEHRVLETPGVAVTLIVGQEVIQQAGGKRVSGAGQSKHSITLLRKEFENICEIGCDTHESLRCVGNTQMGLRCVGNIS